jgi:mono/diheme cytochrome c family protein
VAAEDAKPGRAPVVESGPRGERQETLPPDNARGRTVYEAQNCATCHSLAGEGNPRRPLDDIGARLTSAELRAWTTGTGEAAAMLSEAVVKRKQRYSNLPAEDLDALMAYLSTLTVAKERSGERQE